MEPKPWFLRSFLIYKIISNFSIYPILLTVIVSYTWLDDNILLSSHLPICILLYTESILMVLFPSFLHNVYPVFFVKSTVTAKKTRLNRKQVDISLRFAYTKYKVQEAIFKSVIFNLQQKLIKRTVESHKQFCSIYMQLSRLQSLEEISLLEPISLDNINNLSYHELQTDNKQLQKVGNITLLLFTNATV